MLAIVAVMMAVAAVVAKATLAATYSCYSILGNHRMRSAKRTKPEQLLKAEHDDPTPRTEEHQTTSSLGF